MALLDKIGPNGDLFSSCIGEVAPASSEILRHALERWSQCLVRGGGWGEEVGGERRWLGRGGGWREEVGGERRQASQTVSICSTVIPALNLIGGTTSLVI